MHQTHFRCLKHLFSYYFFVPFKLFFLLVSYCYCCLFNTHMWHPPGRGSLSDEHGGVVSVLAKQAAALSKDPTDSPTVCLESESGWATTTTASSCYFFFFHLHPFLAKDVWPVDVKCLHVVSELIGGYNRRAWKWSWIDYWSDCSRDGAESLAKCFF